MLFLEIPTDRAPAIFDYFDVATNNAPLLWIASLVRLERTFLDWQATPPYEVTAVGANRCLPLYYQDTNPVRLLNSISFKGLQVCLSQPVVNSHVGTERLGSLEFPPAFFTMAHFFPLILGQGLAAAIYPILVNAR